MIIERRYDMYKVFFADDEASMRSGIRNSIDWETEGFTLVGEAPDGELALSLMREMLPDILITDVKMPFMDGIELSRTAKKAMPWLKIIILSGHDEFEYAKEAITIGVEEYLLKPITGDGLTEVLKKVAGQLDAEKEALQNIEKLKSDTRQVRLERLLSGLMYGSASVEPSVNFAKELGLSLFAPYYLVMIIDLSISPGEKYGLLQGACVHLADVLRGWGNTIFFHQGMERTICILKSEDETSLEEEAYTCAQAVKYEAERSAPCTASIAIGSIVNEIAQWPKSFGDTNMARRYLELVNRKQIISIQDIRSGGLMPFNELKKLPAPTKLSYASKADIPQFLDDYFGELDNLSPTSFLFLNYIFVDVLKAASGIIDELGGNASEILSDFRDVSSMLANSNVESVKASLSAILERVIDYRDSLTGSKYVDVIAKAQEYIGRDFHQQSMSLHSVAKKVGMSPNHFSTIFSQETGETFISYVTKIRLEEAKRLLKTTAMRTADIAYAVGYNDTHYFNYVFKKNTGLTPKEFKK